MRTVKTITPGARFGRLVALEDTQTKNHASGSKSHFHECRCDCGAVLFISVYHLANGHTQSCGCLIAEITGERSRTHGLSKSRTYRIWSGMLTRCTNPKAINYPRYGGRGILVCDKWLHSFKSFLEDMGEVPSGRTIERLDSNGNYYKENCTWSTPSEQARNTSRTINLTFNGITLPTVEWAKRIGLDRSVIQDRYHRGWPVDEILTTPIGGRKRK